MSEEREKISEKREKLKIGDTEYEVVSSLRIAGKTMLLVEGMNPQKDMRYGVVQCTENSIITNYSQGILRDDYLEALKDFTERILDEATAIKTEHDARGLPAKLFGPADCYPHSYLQDIKGKVVAIKAEVLNPEYRRGDMQLVYAVGGFGTSASSRGNAVYCYHLNDGTHTRFERYQVLGVVKKLPEWAEQSLAKIREDMYRTTAKKPYVGSYEIIERIVTGRKIFALGRDETVPASYATWEGRIDSAGGFYSGHYHHDINTAKDDLYERAAKEQERLESKKRTASRKRDSRGR
jgi:hypothetical protein